MITPKQSNDNSSTVFLNVFDFSQFSPTWLFQLSYCIESPTQQNLVVSALYNFLFGEKKIIGKGTLLVGGQRRSLHKELRKRGPPKQSKLRHARRVLHAGCN